jgi:hypothetical protein
LVCTHRGFQNSHRAIQVQPSITRIWQTSVSRLTGRLPSSETVSFHLHVLPRSRTDLTGLPLARFAEFTLTSTAFLRTWHSNSPGVTSIIERLDSSAVDGSRMPEKLTNEQRHERFWCGFTHIRVAWAFVAFCGWEVFLNWRELDKPISRPDTIELAFYVLFVMVYALIF